jgi:putative two-component system response regulator
MKGKILIVDDDESIRDVLGELLQREGYELAFAQDGDQALEVYDRFQPDVVLLDIVMPRMNGFEVCRILKHRPDSRLVPVVLVTGLSQIEDRVRGLECGADDLLIKPFDRAELLARVRSLLVMKAYTDELEQAADALFMLARVIEGKDPFTQGHCDRVADYAVRLGQRVGCSEEELSALRIGGVLHDIGKVVIPESVLLKKGQLSDAEWQLVRQHPVVGEQLCAPLTSLRPVLPIIRHHHERFDGSGYPDGLKGAQIPLVARVFQIGDIFDALTTQRPYKAALNRSQAMEIMQEHVNQGWLDSSLLAQFRQVLNNPPAPALRPGNA